MVAYFDASEQGEFLGVGGYMFRKKNVRPFEKQWDIMLRKHGLEYFHMTDCNATPPQKQFAGMDKADCDDAARMAIAAIKEFSTHGFSAVVKPADFYAVAGAKDLFNNPFSLCVHTVVAQCSAWANEHDPVARISYIFESGDEHQKDANKILQSIADNADRRAKYHYEGHAFFPKEWSKPTQAADILAWHVCKQWGREERGVNRLRGDFSDLVDGIRTTKHLFTKDALDEFIAGVVRDAPVPNPERVASLSLRVTNENEKSISREMRALIWGGR
jgi:hypothetical protein